MKTKGTTARAKKTVTTKNTAAKTKKRDPAPKPKVAKRALAPQGIEAPPWLIDNVHHEEDVADAVAKSLPTAGIHTPNLASQLALYHIVGKRWDKAAQALEAIKPDHESAGECMAHIAAYFARAGQTAFAQSTLKKAERWLPAYQPENTLQWIAAAKFLLGQSPRWPSPANEDMLLRRLALVGQWDEALAHFVKFDLQAPDELAWLLITEDSLAQFNRWAPILGSKFNPFIPWLEQRWSREGYAEDALSAALEADLCPPALAQTIAQQSGVQVLGNLLRPRVRAALEKERFALGAEYLEVWSRFDPKEAANAALPMLKGVAQNLRGSSKLAAMMIQIFGRGEAYREMEKVIEHYPHPLVVLLEVAPLSSALWLKTFKHYVKQIGAGKHPVTQWPYLFSVLKRSPSHLEDVARVCEKSLETMLRSDQPLARWQLAQAFALVEDWAAAERIRKDGSPTTARQCAASFARLAASKGNLSAALNLVSMLPAGTSSEERHHEQMEILFQVAKLPRWNLV